MNVTGEFLLGLNTYLRPIAILDFLHILQYCVLVLVHRSQQARIKALIRQMTTSPKK